MYKETELMLAVETIKKGRYNEALKYIATAREWPENLGVGKPYQNDIDERLEDWMAYDVYTKQGNDKAAEDMLQKIITFTQEQNKNASGYPSSNNIISAWAFEKLGQQEQAEKWLNGWMKKEPQNAWSKWALAVYKGQPATVADDTRTDENYRVLQQWMALSSTH